MYVICQGVGKTETAFQMANFLFAKKTRIQDTKRSGQYFEYVFLILNWIDYWSHNIFKILRIDWRAIFNCASQFTIKLPITYFIGFSLLFYFRSCQIYAEWIAVVARRGLYAGIGNSKRGLTSGEKTSGLAFSSWSDWKFIPIRRHYFPLLLFYKFQK